MGSSEYRKAALFLNKYCFYPYTVQCHLKIRESLQHLKQLTKTRDLKLKNKETLNYTIIYVYNFADYKLYEYIQDKTKKKLYQYTYIIKYLSSNQ